MPHLGYLPASPTLSIALPRWSSLCNQSHARKKTTAMTKTHTATLTAFLSLWVFFSVGLPQCGHRLAKRLTVPPQSGHGIRFDVAGGSVVGGCAAVTLGMNKTVISPQCGH